MLCNASPCGSADHGRSRFRSRQGSPRSCRSRPRRRQRDGGRIGIVKGHRSLDALQALALAETALEFPSFGGRRDRDDVEIKPLLRVASRGERYLAQKRPFAIAVAFGPQDLEPFVMQGLPRRRFLLVGDLDGCCVGKPIARHSD